MRVWDGAGMAAGAGGFGVSVAVGGDWTMGVLGPSDAVSSGRGMGVLGASEKLSKFPDSAMELASELKSNPRAESNAAPPPG